MEMSNEGYADGVGKAVEAIIDIKLRGYERGGATSQDVAEQEQELRAARISLGAALEKLITGWIKLGRH